MSRPDRYRVVKVIFDNGHLSDLTIDDDYMTYESAYERLKDFSNSSKNYCYKIEQYRRDRRK